MDVRRLKKKKKFAVTRLVMILPSDPLSFTAISVSGDAEKGYDIRGKEKVYRYGCVISCHARYDLRRRASQKPLFPTSHVADSPRGLLSVYGALSIFYFVKHLTIWLDIRYPRPKYIKMSKAALFPNFVSFKLIFLPSTSRLTSTKDKNGTNLCLNHVFRYQGVMIREKGKNIEGRFFKCFSPRSFR